MEKTPKVQKPTVVSALCVARFLVSQDPAPLRAGIGVSGSLQLASDRKNEFVIVTATESGLYDDRSKELIRKTPAPAEIPHDEKYHAENGGRSLLSQRILSGSFFGLPERAALG